MIRTNVVILSVCMARMNVRPCMDKICAMFEKLKNLAGQHIGVNSFQYLTIAAVAIYRCYFLPENAIMVVPRPGNDMHSNQQIAWFNEVMCTQLITISHAHTGRRLGAGEAHVPIEPRDPRKKTLEVNSELEKFMFLSRPILSITRRNVDSKWMAIACLRKLHTRIIAVFGMDAPFVTNKT